MRSGKSLKSLSLRRVCRETPAVAELLEKRALLSAVVVNTTLDQIDPPASKTVSLRDAVTIANASTTPTVITFNSTAFATAKTITLKSQLELSNASHAITITGPAAGVTISGNKVTRVFVVDGGVTASLAGLTIASGKVTGSNIQSDGGAGILNNGTLTLNKVTLSGNSTNGLGGAIRNLHLLTITNSTINGNSTSYVGGAIYNGNWPTNPGTTTLTMTNVTIAGNSAASGAGAAIYNDDYGGGSVVKLRDVTIANNSDTGSTGDTPARGAVVNAPPNRGTPVISLANTIIAGNTISLVTTPDVSGAFTSQGFNLIGQTDGSTGWKASDRTGTHAHPLSAKLGSLANNGGPTQTLLPLAGSPAIDHGSNALIPSGVTLDQRGLTRIVNGTVDIGAVEVQPAVTPGSISGKVFGDTNGDGKINNGEFGVGLWTVYLDLNKDGKLDAGDKSVTTDINGNWSFTGLAPQTYLVRVVPVAGIAATKPTGALLTITLAAGQVSAGNLFGERAIS